MSKALLLANLFRTNTYARLFLQTLNADTNDLHVACRASSVELTDYVPNVEQVEAVEWAAKILSGDYTKADLVIFPNEVATLMDTNDWFND